MMRMIAAIDRERGMATGDGIPWDLPTDRQFFEEQLVSGLILMGYGTYTEIEEPLQDRINYVATRQRRPLRPGFASVCDVPLFVREHSTETINNIGGPGLCTTTLSLSDELILTRIDGDFGCTKFFPAFEADFDRRTVSQAVTENGATFAFETWVRQRPSDGA